MTILEELQGLKDTVAFLQESQALLRMELLALRSARVKADPDSIEELLAYIFSEFRENAWKADDVWSQSCGSPFLKGAIKRCLGKRITSRKLSYLFGNSVGIWGWYKLECVNEHSRDGRLFCVTKLVTSSQTPNAIVGSHNRS